MSAARPLPHELHAQAVREHPDDRDAMRRRYHDLMVEHGHLIPVDPDEHCPDCGRLLSCVGSCHHCQDRRSR